jgi:hypothetical protein
MAIEIDDKDYTVQYTDEEGDDTWKSDGVFADPHSAKQHAEHVIHTRKVASVRVVETRYYAWREEGGKIRLNDGIGERKDKSKT